MTAGTPHQALYRRWRAQTFSEIVGQEAVVCDAAQRRPHRARVARDPVHRSARHRQDVAGPDPGQGAQLPEPRRQRRSRATPASPAPPSARVAPSTWSRSTPRPTAASTTSASSASASPTRPPDLARKVYILDEAHQITKDAWNALLKSLEEPPDFVVFMFASTHPQDFPPAILSRLQRFDIRRLTVAEITGKLERILAADGREVDPEAVRLIARLAAGGMRDAESILDQLLSSTGGPDRGRRRARPARPRRVRAGEPVHRRVRQRVTPRRASSSSTARGARAGPARLPRPGRRRAARASRRRAGVRMPGGARARRGRPPPRRHRSDAPRRRRPPPPAGAGAARARRRAGHGRHRFAPASATRPAASPGPARRRRPRAPARPACREPAAAPPGQRAVAPGRARPPARDRAIAPGRSVDRPRGARRRPYGPVTAQPVPGHGSASPPCPLPAASPPASAGPPATTSSACVSGWAALVDQITDQPRRASR